MHEHTNLCRGVLLPPLLTVALTLASPISGATHSMVDMALLEAPVAMKRHVPLYPEELERSRTSGLVTLEAVIDTQGRPRQVEVVTSDSDAFAAAALKAVKRWVFTPATYNGQAVAVVVRLPVYFAAERTASAEAAVAEPVLGELQFIE